MAGEPEHPEAVLRDGRGYRSERPMYHKKTDKITVLVECTIWWRRWTYN